MANSPINPLPLQKFSKKPDTWRFMRAARTIQTETPSQKLILMLLASHINGKDGSCYPSYARLMRESGFTSKQTITDALHYLRDTLKIVTWKKGWGNAFVPNGKSNRYQFDAEIMCKLADESPSDTILESPSDGDESPFDSSRKSISQGRKLTPVGTKYQRGSTSYAEVPALKRDSAQILDSNSRQNAPQANLEESPPDGLSSPAYVIPDFTEYDHGDRKWYARRGIGRPLTADEISQMQRLNEARVRPPQ